MKKDLIIFISILASLSALFMLVFLVMDNFDVNQTLDSMVYVLFSAIFFPAYLFGFLLKDTLDNNLMILGLLMVSITTIFWFGVYKLFFLVKGKLLRIKFKK